MDTILVVDDAATVRAYHRKLLEQRGYEVDEAINGIEAIEKAMQRGFALYVVDINMPKLDGYGFLQELRNMDVRQSPAIMVSTEADETDRDRAFLCGANYYMVKPVKPEEFIRVVEILLGGQNDGCLA